MDRDYKKNYDEKIKLILDNLNASIDHDFSSMLAKHSANGQLRSGNTISETINIIMSSNNQLLLNVLDHMNTLKMQYYPMIETHILQIAQHAQDIFKLKAYDIFAKSTKQSGKPELYDRMLPNLEENMAKIFAEFRNRLNSTVIELKRKSLVSATAKILWRIDAVLLFVSAIIAGMWIENPSGNFEPILAGLTILIMFIAFIAKKKTHRE